MNHFKTIIIAMIPSLVWLLGAGQAAGQSNITEILQGGVVSPRSITVDTAGNVYVAGSSNAFKITPAGVTTEIINASGDGAGNDLKSPTGIAVDAMGNAYVAGDWTISSGFSFLTSHGFSLFKITSAGVITLIREETDDGSDFPDFSDFLDASQELFLSSPQGIAVDAMGNAYVAGAGSDNVIKITPDGVITEIIDATGDGAGNTLNSPSSIAVDASGTVYVATGKFGSGNAFKITSSGVITQIIDAAGDGAGNGLTGPSAIAVDAAGNVYVTGGGSDNAFKITPAGVITQIIDRAGDGGDPTISEVINSGDSTPTSQVIGIGLHGPAGIAADAMGNAYVTGQASRNAFKITPGGVITEIINLLGDGTGNTLEAPSAIAVDGAGNVYVSGAKSDNVFKITPGGISDEPPDVDAGDDTGDTDAGGGTDDMDPTMDDEANGAGTTPTLCGAAMMGTFLMTLLGLLSLSSAYQRGYVLPRR